MFQIIACTVWGRENQVEGPGLDSEGRESNTEETAWTEDWSQDAVHVQSASKEMNMVGQIIWMY